MTLRMLRTTVSMTTCMLRQTSSFGRPSRTLALKSLMGSSEALQKGCTSPRWFSCSSVQRCAPQESKKEDLLVEYLDGPNQGIVVFGLNRPEVKIIIITFLSFETSIRKKLAKKVF